MLKELLRSAGFVRSLLLIAALVLLAIGLMAGELDLTRIESGTL